MLNALDDYPIHQTPLPLAYPATSDRNVYDRTWFNGYGKDGSWYFGFGMAIYPHRGILDAAFSTVTEGGLQHCFYGSRRAPAERTDMSVGPLRLEVIEPLRNARIILEDNDSGLACDLVFCTRTAGIQEARQTLFQGTRAVMDATRFDQFGTWEGILHTPDGDIRVDPESSRGTKDRSWGVRAVGEPEGGGAPVTPKGIAFMWAPLFWEDHVSHAIFFDGPEGEALVREGLTAPLYPNAEAVPAQGEARETRMATARHRIRYHKGTRLAEAVEIDLVPLEGELRSITLTPGLKFQMKGLGYGHPEWGQGMWKGELTTGHERFDPRQLDPLARENLHTQQIVTASDGQRAGIGVFEQIVVGPYAPAGFKEFFDGAR